MLQTRHFVVSGRVQGVGFRASCRHEALRLGLSGSAVNLPDGAVRVLACGPVDALQTLQHWLWQGPRWARVDFVEELPLAEHMAAPLPGFTVG